MVGPTQITAEHDPMTAEVHEDRSRSEDVARWLQDDVDTVGNGRPRQELHPTEQGQDGLRILSPVQGLRLRMLGVPLLSRVPGLFLLKLRAVPKDELGELCRRSGGKDRTGEPLGNQCRQVSAVVQVGMAENDSVDLRR